MAREATNQNELAEALIRLGVVGREQLNAELDAAKAKTQEYAQAVGTQVPTAHEKAKKSAEGLGGGMQSLRHYLKENTEAFTALIARITAVVGVTALFYSIGERIGDVLFNNTQRAKEYDEALQGLNESIDKGVQSSSARFSPEAYVRAGLNKEGVDEQRKRKGELEKKLAEYEQANPVAASVIQGQSKAERLAYITGLGPEYSDAQQEAAIRYRKMEGLAPGQEYALNLKRLAESGRMLTEENKRLDRAEQQEKMLKLLEQIAANTKSSSMGN